MIEAALIILPSRADEPVFGRPLLERLAILCRRAGIRRFIVEAPATEHPRVRVALGSLQSDPTIEIVDTFRNVEGLDANAGCVQFSGNVVLAQAQLQRIFEVYLAQEGKPFIVISTDHEQGGRVAVGTLAEIVEPAATTNPVPSELATVRAGTKAQPSPVTRSSLLPFALNGRPQDRAEAEVRLARSVSSESIRTDTFMARVLDRRLSWRLSLRLARTRITPNQVTLSNTAIGLGCAAMLASSNYWLRLFGALLFVVSITLDGVDGELARLRMLESRFGQRLDVLTDNLVHVAVFIGMAIGCYHVSASPAYFYALAILLAGFGACAISVNRALSIAGDKAQRWIGQVERITGRDFAYLVFILALFDRLDFFIWGTAFGTHIFALTLWWFTSQYRRSAALAAARNGAEPAKVSTIAERQVCN